MAMACRRGVRGLVGLGMCGALSEELEIGDIVVPLAAVLTRILADTTHPRRTLQLPTTPYSAYWSRR